MCYGIVPKPLRLHFDSALDQLIRLKGLSLDQADDLIFGLSAVQERLDSLCRRYSFKSVNVLRLLAERNLEDR